MKNLIGIVLLGSIALSSVVAIASGSKVSEKWNVVGVSVFKFDPADNAFNPNDPTWSRNVVDVDREAKDLALASLKKNLVDQSTAQERMFGHKVESIVEGADCETQTIVEPKTMLSLTKAVCKGYFILTRK